MRLGTSLTWTLLFRLLPIVLGVSTVVAQKKSDRQDYELVGPVKTVRCEDKSFDYVDGVYIEHLNTTPMTITTTFDLEGTKINEVVDINYPLCGFRAPDCSKRVYDRDGKLVEYMPNDTIEHSSYRLLHIYDSDGRRKETEYYNPYILQERWIYKYEAFDDRGNWTRRIVTDVPPPRVYSRTIQYRSISYF